MLAARAAARWLPPRAASSARFCAPTSRAFPALARRSAGLPAWRASERGGQARGVHRVRRTVVGEDPLLRAPRTRPPPGDPRLVNVLIGANAAVFGMWHLDGISKDWMMRHFTCSLESFFSGRLHTLLTCAFSHVALGHLGLNMVGLYFFGPTALASLGNARFLMLYAAAAVVGSLAQLFFEYRDAIRKASAMRNAYGAPPLIHARPSCVAAAAQARRHTRTALPILADAAQRRSRPHPTPFAMRQPRGQRRRAGSRVLLHPGTALRPHAPLLRPHARLGGRPGHAWNGLLWHAAPVPRGCERPLPAQPSNPATQQPPPPPS